MGIYDPPDSILKCVWIFIIRKISNIIICSPVQRSVFVKAPLFTWQDLSNSPLIQLLNNPHITMMEQEEYMYSNVTFTWKSFKDSCRHQQFLQIQMLINYQHFQTPFRARVLAAKGLLLVMSFPIVSVVRTANRVKVKNFSSAYRPVPPRQNT